MGKPIEPLLVQGNAGINSIPSAMEVRPVGVAEGVAQQIGQAHYAQMQHSNNQMLYLQQQQHAQATPMPQQQAQLGSAGAVPGTFLGPSQPAMPDGGAAPGTQQQ